LSASQLPACENTSIQATTETVILYVKKGVNLDGAKDSPAVQAFFKLTSTLKIQESFMSQYCVIGISLAFLKWMLNYHVRYQLENSIVSVWYISNHPAALWYYIFIDY